MQGYPYISNAFQMDAIERGSLRIPSPFGEGFIESRNSFPVYDDFFCIPAVLYEFSEPHHLVVGTGMSWNGAISFYWFVDQNILVFHRYIELIGDWRPILRVLRSYVKLCEKWRKPAQIYRKSAKVTACFCSSNFNLGHSIWNDFSGVERVIRAGKRVPMLVGPTNRFAIQDVFTDDKLDTRSENLGSADDVLKTTLDNNYFLVRPTGTRVDAVLAQKIRKSAENKVATAGRLTTIRPEDGGFVLFYNIRAHNKVWLEQADGAVDLVRRLRNELNVLNLTLFLDGFGDCSDIVADITGRVDGLCEVVDGTNISLFETVMWAFRCDYYVAVIGSGLTLLTWLAAKPGVCHGDHGHLDQVTWWHTVRPDCIPPLCPALGQIKNVEEKYYSNYTMDPSVISDLAINYLSVKYENLA